MKYYLIYKWNGRANQHACNLVRIETDHDKAKTFIKKLKEENTISTVTFELRELIQD